MQRKFITAVLACGVGVVATVGAGRADEVTPVPANEQTQSVPGRPNADTRGGGVEEVVVTARRREEGVQSVPLSVTALSAKSLEERNVRSLADVANFTPNVTFDQGARSSGGSSASQIYIRGVGQDNSYATSDPAVGIYIDGVYYGRTVGSVMDIVDLERIEVLRGPQGTLYGKNTMGGAISLVSALPEGDTNGYGEVGYGRFNEINVKTGLQFPISDQLAARVSFSARRRDGYEVSRVDGTDQNDVDSLAGRAILKWTPGDSVSLVLIGDVSRVRQNGQAQHVLAVNPNAAGLRAYNQFVAPTLPYGAFDARWIANGHYNYANGPHLIGSNTNDIDVAGVSGTLAWALSDSVRLTSISAYRTLDSKVGTDADGSPLNLYSGYIVDEQHQFSQELRLDGDGFGDRLHWLIGTYYFDEHMDDFISQRILDGLAPYGLDLTPNQRSELDNQSYAGFGQAIFEFTPTWSATLGLRYTHEKKRDVAGSIAQDTGRVLLPPGSTLEHDWSAMTPKVSVEYQPREGFLAYASVAEGFKSGGINYAVTSASDFQIYDPEEVTTYEVGFKSDWADNRLRVNGAVFYSDYRDLQFAQVISPGQYTCPASAPALCNLTINAAGVEIKGAELEVTARPFEALNISFGLGYTDNKFDKIDPALLAGNVIDYGTQLPKTPKWSGNLGVQYRWLLSSGSVTARADYAYKSDVYTDIANTPVLEQQSFGLLGARLSYQTVDEKWELALSGTNLTDELYITSGYSYLDGALGYAIAGYGAPRLYSASVKYRFGE